MAADEAQGQQQCQVCNAADARYTCPCCQKRTCSLQCVKGARRCRPPPCSADRLPALLLRILVDATPPCPDHVLCLTLLQPTRRRAGAAASATAPRLSGAPSLTSAPFSRTTASWKRCSWPGTWPSAPSRRPPSRSCLGTWPCWCSRRPAAACSSTSCPQAWSGGAATPLATTLARRPCTGACTGGSPLPTASPQLTRGAVVQLGSRGKSLTAPVARLPLGARLVSASRLQPRC